LFCVLADMFADRLGELLCVFEHLNDRCSRMEIAMRTVADSRQRVVDEARTQGLFRLDQRAQRSTQVTPTGLVDTPDDSSVQVLDEDLDVCQGCGVHYGPCQCSDSD
jgi:hypothetical protein